MALTQATKDFFIGRINKTIDEQINELTKQMNLDEAQEMALQQYLSDVGIEDLFDELVDNIEEVDRLKKTIKNLAEKICEKVTTEDDYLSVPYQVENMIGNITSRANRMFLHAFKEALYPEQIARVKELDAMKDDVEGAVLLSTTETNVRFALTSLLERYGGDLRAIERMLPPLA